MMSPRRIIYSHSLFLTDAGGLGILGRQMMSQNVFGLIIAIT
jgi:hypothetical protein